MTDPDLMNDQESCFMMSVARELRNAGWQVDQKIHVLKHVIDLGILHPDTDGNYLAGVEQDLGPTHFPDLIQRLAHSHLTGALGWRLLRIRLDDWEANKTEELKRLDSELHRFLEEDRQAHPESDRSKDTGHAPPIASAAPPDPASPNFYKQMQPVLHRMMVDAKDATGGQLHEAEDLMGYVLSESMGDPEAAAELVARYLDRNMEEFIKGTTDDIASWMYHRRQWRSEFVDEDDDNFWDEEDEEDEEEDEGEDIWDVYERKKPLLFQIMKNAKNATTSLDQAKTMMRNTVYLSVVKNPDITSAYVEKFLEEHWREFIKDHEDGASWLQTRRQFRSDFGRSAEEDVTNE